MKLTNLTINKDAMVCANILKAFGHKDVSKLQKKQITNKAGKKQTVYVKVQTGANNFKTVGIKANSDKEATLKARKHGMVIGVKNDNEDDSPEAMGKRLREKFIDSYRPKQKLSYKIGEYPTKDSGKAGETQHEKVVRMAKERGWKKSEKPKGSSMFDLVTHIDGKKIKKKKEYPAPGEAGSRQMKRKKPYNERNRPYNESWKN